MNNEQTYNVQNKITFKSSTDHTFELSKKQLSQRYDINLNRIINGFKKVTSFNEAQRAIEKDGFYRVIIPNDISEIRRWECRMEFRQNWDAATYYKRPERFIYMSGKVRRN